MFVRVMRTSMDRGSGRRESLVDRGIVRAARDLPNDHCDRPKGPFRDSALAGGSAPDEPRTLPTTEPTSAVDPLL